jgi:nucleotide-binding universal stress UspA family protein
MQIMVSVKTILVATDFSEASAAALAYGRELAHALGSSLHVLHVVGNVVAGAVVGIEGYTTDYVTLQREVEHGARKHLETIVTEDDRRALAAKTIVLTSNTPAQSIVSYAKDAGIDLVIVGTHGRGGIEHFAIGSVAERVVRLAPCPVLTIRHPAHQRMPAEARQIAAEA